MPRNCEGARSRSAQRDRGWAKAVLLQGWPPDTCSSSSSQVQKKKKKRIGIKSKHRETSVCLSPC